MVFYFTTEGVGDLDVFITKFLSTSFIHPFRHSTQSSMLTITLEKSLPKAKMTVFILFISAINKLIFNIEKQILFVAIISPMFYKYFILRGLIHLCFCQIIRLIAIWLWFLAATVYTAAAGGAFFCYDLFFILFYLVFIISVSLYWFVLLSCFYFLMFADAGAIFTAEGHGFLRSFFQFEFYLGRVYVFLGRFLLLFVSLTLFLCFCVNHVIILLKRNYK